MRFRWVTLVDEVWDGRVLGEIAESRARKRWAIEDLTWRTVARPRQGDHYLELEWTYTATGGSVNDGRRFISLVLCELLDISPERPERYLLDARALDADLWPDVQVLAQPSDLSTDSQLAEPEVADADRCALERWEDESL